MLLFITWVILSAFVGWAASNRGRSGLGWFLISCVISPLLGVLVLIAVPSLAPNTHARNDDRSMGGRTKTCPRCAEIIKADAKICRFCGHNVDLQARLASLELPTTAGGEGVPLNEGEGTETLVPGLIAPSASPATSADRASSSESKRSSAGALTTLGFFAFVGVLLIFGNKSPNESVTRTPSSPSYSPQLGSFLAQAKSETFCGKVVTDADSIGLTHYSDYDIKKSLCRSVEEIADALGKDDKFVERLCYAASIRLMGEFKRRFPGESPKGKC